MGLDERHDSLEQLVAGGVALGVVDGLQSDDVDVGDDEPSAGPAAAVQLVVEVGQARRARACPGQLVGLGERDLACERLAVDEGAQPLVGRPFAVLCCGLTVLGGERALLGGLCAALRGALALTSGADEPVGAGQRARVGALLSGLTLCDRQIARLGGLVSRARREVAGVGDRVAPGGCLQAPAGGLLALASVLLALAGGALTHVPAELVRTRVDARREVAIAGGLIAVGGQLVAVGARLVAVRARLIGVREGLVAVGKPLLAVGKRLLDWLRSVGEALLLSLDLPVRGTDGTIA